MHFKTLRKDDMMTRTAVVFSPEYYKHETGRNHPETAKRLRAILNELTQGKLSKSKNWRFVEPYEAAIEEVRLVHDIKYINYVRALCRSGGGLLDSGDTVVSSDSYKTALYAVGGALTAVNLVMKHEFTNSFALVRPPGHHATKFYGLGFCIFNNVAVAARHLLQGFKLKRVLILDIDSHHGNGTQEVFYKTDKVLYISLHENPRDFPGTGFVKEVGEDKGKGYTVNIPLPFKTADDVYLKAWKEIVEPISRQYKPQFVLVSAGLDCHYADPIGRLSLSTLCYDKIFHSIVKIASETCNERLGMILEGGYNLEHIGKIAAAAIAKMSGSKHQINAEFQTKKNNARSRGEMLVRNVKRVQKAYWSLE